MKACTVVGVIGAAALVASIGGCKAGSPAQAGSVAKEDGKGRLVVRADEVGVLWPLIVPEVELECGSDRAIFGRYGSVTFALNAEAQRQAASLGRQVSPLDELRKDDLDKNFYIPGAKVPMDALMRLADQRCGKDGARRA